MMNSTRVWPPMRAQQKQELGRKGEEMACRFLRHKGYTVLERNYRHGRLEADLICRLGRILVVVEVKTRTGEDYGPPEDAVHYDKQLNLAHLAGHYLRRAPWARSVRFDICSVVKDARGRLNLVHLPDAFFPGL